MKHGFHHTHMSAVPCPASHTYTVPHALIACLSPVFFYPIRRSSFTGKHRRTHGNTYTHTQHLSFPPLSYARRQCVRGSEDIASQTRPEIDIKTYPCCCYCCCCCSCNCCSRWQEKWHGIHTGSNVNLIPSLSSNFAPDS